MIAAWIRKLLGIPDALTVHVKVELDGSQIAQAVHRELLNRARRNGGEVR